MDANIARFFCEPGHLRPVKDLHTAEFNPDQPRDDHGRWTDTPGDTPGFPPTDRPRLGNMNSPEAQDKIDTGIDYFAERLSPEQNEALDAYINDAGPINSALRANPEKIFNVDNESSRAFKKMPEALQRAWYINEAVENLRAPAIVYRGTSLSDATEKKLNTIGATVRFKGLVSTTFDPIRATRFQGGTPILEILARRGTLGNGGEEELILEHGSRFKVVGVKTVDIQGGSGSVWERPGKQKIIQLEQLK